MPSSATRTFLGMLTAIVFVASSFVSAVCVYKISRERIRANSHSEFIQLIRRYTDGFEKGAPREWRKWSNVKSAGPLLRLSAGTAAWLAVATLSGLVLWLRLRPRRPSIRQIVVSEVLVAFALAAILTCLEPYQRERLRIFFDPSRDPYGVGYSFHVRENFIPRWPATAVVVMIVAAGALPGLYAASRGRTGIEP